MYVCVWPSDDRKKALVQQQERSRQEALSVLKVGTTVHDNNRIHTYIHTYIHTPRSCNRKRKTMTVIETTTTRAALRSQRRCANVECEFLK